MQDVANTYDLTQTGKFHIHFRKDPPCGTHLFTTDLSDTSFFCSRDLVAASLEAKLTNFQFVPTTWATNYNGPGVGRVEE